MQFTGTYQNTVDDKGRLNFPAKLRSHMGEEFIVTRWLDDCLVAFPPEMWESVSAKLSELPIASSRKIRRFLYSGAETVAPDKQGRIVLPALLREHAGIEKEAVVIGVGTYVEIWSRSRHADMADDFDKENLEEIMAGLEF